MIIKVKVDNNINKFKEEIMKQQQAQIATKNLQYVSEILMAEQLNYAKLNAYKSEVKDEKIKDILTKLATASEKRYTKVLEYLKSHQSN